MAAQASVVQQLGHGKARRTAEVIGADRRAARMDADKRGSDPESVLIRVIRVYPRRTLVFLPSAPAPDDTACSHKKAGANKLRPSVVLAAIKLT